ncbi:very short patch repair endonuclease [Embleya hyalina]|uniref:XorII very-short-patch-repair endonuclease n=1 Tax=Embleya hyalina TaxID=516124 RepID=A0A401YXH5_9ACTN|nr:very short patch repair endonuclease [Embleya hyalina]GCD99324.1 XorII very-short-patch-repair endonuclease [Embleya hyalina]
MNPQARSAEQDRAAGGIQRRAVNLGDGNFARASIALKVYPKTRRIRAYLRWSDQGRTRTRYVGEVDQPTRAANLAQAWRKAQTDQLVTTEPLPEGSWASSPAVRRSMTGNRGRDTKPELRLRSALHRRGLRYRVSVRPEEQLRRTADVVFVRSQVAVFVDGCYWHGCPEHHRPSSKNTAFWRQKIDGNRIRDAETTSALEAAGWTVVRVWEHEDADEAARRIAGIVRSKS